MQSRITISLFLLFLPVLVTGQTADQHKYVNYEYKGVGIETMLPNSVKYLGGGLIGNIDADPVYGISEVTKGKNKMLWLEISTGRDSTGVTGWKVLDVLSFPTIKKSEYVYFQGDPSINCTRRRNELPNLVGVGQILRRRWVFKSSKLWIANLRTKKFEQISLTGVKCKYSEP